jgi:hypothetical protein
MGRCKTRCKAQQGNVLFLILIAVVLFAALSYAVSQTMRGGSDKGVTEEKARVNSVYIHQFPTSIRQAMLRMRVSNNLGQNEVSFAHPGDVTYGVFGTDPAREVFHPQGGAVPYQTPPAGINDGTDWIFNGSLEVANVGITPGTAAGADLIAMLPGVSLEICTYLNEGFSGVSSPPPSLNLVGENTQFTGTYTYNDTISDAALDGKDAFCYYSQALGKYVYYHTLIER